MRQRGQSPSDRHCRRERRSDSIHAGGPLWLGGGGGGATSFVPGLENFCDLSVHVALSEEPGDREPLRLLPLQLAAVGVKHQGPLLHVHPNLDGNHGLAGLHLIAQLRELAYHTLHILRTCLCAFVCVCMGGGVLTINLATKMPCQEGHLSMKLLRFHLLLVDGVNDLSENTRHAFLHRHVGKSSAGMEDGA